MNLAASGLLAAGVVALTVRMLISLGVVLAVIAVGYAVARRRSGRPKSQQGRTPRWLSLSKPQHGRVRRGGNDRLNHRSGLEVVGRVGLTRGAAAVALRFGDRVVLVAASETGQASVVAEMPLREWDDAEVVREPLEFPVQRTSSPDPTAQPGFVEALRLATSRRA
ncbi:MAG TPA: hypothetical protein VNQ73_10815 [Ilumatobacter sp.]|nr:hypothetical protein [Ilumatobacter sp.]